MTTYNNTEIARITDAVLEDAREFHRAAFVVARTETTGHSALSEQGPDVDCLTCGHINEAEYMVAELSA